MSSAYGRDFPGAERRNLFCCLWRFAEGKEEKEHAGKSEGNGLEKETAPSSENTENLEFSPKEPQKTYLPCKGDKKADFQVKGETLWQISDHFGRFVPLRQRRQKLRPFLMMYTAGKRRQGKWEYTLVLFWP